MKFKEKTFRRNYGVKKGNYSKIPSLNFSKYISQNESPLKELRFKY